MFKKSAILFLILVFIVTSGFGCKTTSTAVSQAMKPITLNYWRVDDGPDDFTEILAQYKALHPYITINYKKLRLSEYESELLNAFAEDRGPDIFSVHNTWVKKYESKIAPMPAETRVVVPVLQGTIKKETVPQLMINKSLTLRDLKNNFVDSVYYDVVSSDNKIYGLPLSSDTLVMYYNQDLFNNSGITEVPKYWNRDFQQTVKRLTKQDLKGNIIQSGVAMGGSSNIDRYSDILSVIMIQNGAIMQNGDQVSFNKVPSSAQQANYNPGLSALRFYTDFANPIKEVYSWNTLMPNSLDAFIGGNLGIMFGYSYQLPIIKARAPKLNFSVAKLPQIEGSAADINFANYWVETVSKKSANSNEAWDFVQFAANAENVKSYLGRTKKPAALRTLLKDQIQDEEIGIFADQVLTARTWYKGYNSAAAEKAIAEMIDTAIVNTDEAKIQEALNLGASKVQQTVDAR